MAAPSGVNGSLAAGTVDAMGSASRGRGVDGSWHPHEPPRDPPRDPPQEPQAQGSDIILLYGFSGGLQRPGS